MLGREANFLLKRLAQSTSIKWDKPQDGCVQTLLRATNLCLRGSRTKWRFGVGIGDGAVFHSFIVSFIYFFVYVSVLVVMVSLFIIIILTSHIKVLYILRVIYRC